MCVCVWGGGGGGGLNGILPGNTTGIFSAISLWLSSVTASQPHCGIGGGLNRAN